MLLRGQATPNQLLFDPEIDRTSRRNRGRNSRRRRRRLFVEENKEMAEETPVRRTLGDYVSHQGPRYHSSIVIPPNARTLELKTAHLNLISAHQFAGLDHENPNLHLSNFYELIGTMGFDEGRLESVYLRLFPFSLIGKAKEWLQSHPNQSLTNWGVVEEKFLNRFFPSGKLIEAKAEISTFRQRDDEPLYEAWERFKSLLRKCPNHGFEDIAQLNMFCKGLRPDSKSFIDAAAGGTILSAEVNQALQIINNLAMNDQQAQSGRQSAQLPKGMLELNQSDALLA